MAKFTGTMVVADAKGLREDLSDMIHNISPTKTPGLSMFGRGKAKAILHEWQEDSLAAADTTNAKAEANETSFSTPSSTTRIGNYCQISDKSVLIGGTLEAVDKAGRKSEVAYQTAKRAAELKRDMESILFTNQAASGTDPRKLGSLLAFIKTNVDYATASGTNPTYTTLPNDTRDDATAGDLRTFQETQLETVLQSMWENGAEPSVIFLGADSKQAFSGFAGEYSKTFNTSGAKESAIVASADVYVSDFGIVRTVLNRFMRTRDVIVADPEYVKVSYLRPYAVRDLAATGDTAAKKLINVEYTLEVGTEKALGGIFDLKA